MTYEDGMRAVFNVTQEIFDDAGISLEGCCNYNGLDYECVSYQLAESMEECLDYEFVGCEESPNGICPESFDFVETGEGFTCQVASISFKYFGAFDYTYTLGTFCIQVPDWNSDYESINPYDASVLMAIAWKGAQVVTGSEAAFLDHNLTNQEYKDLFLTNLRFAKGLEFSDQGYPYSVSSGPCLGNIPETVPKYSIFCQ